MAISEGCQRHRRARHPEPRPTCSPPRRRARTTTTDRPLVDEFRRPVPVQAPYRSRTPPIRLSHRRRTPAPMSALCQHPRSRWQRRSQPRAGIRPSSARGAPSRGQWHRTPALSPRLCA